MVSRQEIQATCDDIVREFAPLQVILFGSYGYGTPTEDSDVDLLVVMAIPESETRRQAAEIRRRIPDRFPMDLLVRSKVSQSVASRGKHSVCENTRFGKATEFDSPYAPGLGGLASRFLNNF